MTPNIHGHTNSNHTVTTATQTNNCRSNSHNNTHNIITFYSSSSQRLGPLWLGEVHNYDDDDGGGGGDGDGDDDDDDDDEEEEEEEEEDDEDDEEQIGNYYYLEKYISKLFQIVVIHNLLLKHISWVTEFYLDLATDIQNDQCIMHLLIVHKKYKSWYFI